MSVEFDHDAVMQIFENKRKRFLLKTGHMGVSLAAVNSRVDTGTSQNAKFFSFSEGGTTLEATPTSFKYAESGAKFKDRIFLKAPISYDVYLERRYGIMVKTVDELIPYMVKFEEEEFG